MTPVCLHKWREELSLARASDCKAPASGCNGNRPIRGARLLAWRPLHADRAWVPFITPQIAVQPDMICQEFKWRVALHGCRRGDGLGVRNAKAVVARDVICGLIRSGMPLESRLW